MSYNKTIWKPGDIITTEKWNNLTNNAPSSKIIQIPFESIENEGTTIGKLLITSEQLNNYIQNGYLCYYVNDNDEFYYYQMFDEWWYFGNGNSQDRGWTDNGNGYLEMTLGLVEEPGGKEEK